MPTPPVDRRLVALMAPAMVAGAFVMAGCGKVEADRGEIAEHLGDAYGAYLTYVAEPVQAGALGPSTAPNTVVAERSKVAARYVVRAVEAARTEAAPDATLASFAQKTAAAGASLNAVSTVVSQGEPTKAFVAGGRASLESLIAAGRDLGLTIERRKVSTEELERPPAG